MGHCWCSGSSPRRWGQDLQFFLVTMGKPFIHGAAMSIIVFLLICGLLCWWIVQISPGNVDKCSSDILFCPQLKDLSVYCHGGVKKPENIYIWGADIRNLSLFSQKMTPVNQSFIVKPWKMGVGVRLLQRSCCPGQSDVCHIWESLTINLFSPVRYEDQRSICKCYYQCEWRILRIIFLNDQFAPPNISWKGT